MPTTRPTDDPLGTKLYAAGLALCFATGLLLRFWQLGGPSLWLDEILHSRIARSIFEEPWYRFFLGYAEVSRAPENGTLYYLLQNLGMRLADGEVGVRLLPALLGTATLPLMAAVAYRWQGRVFSLVATLFLALSPLHVYFSREGRPYALVMLLALLFLGLLLLRSLPSVRTVGWIAAPLATYSGIHSVPILSSFAALSLLALVVERREPETRRTLQHLVGAATVSLLLSSALYLLPSDVNRVVVEENRVERELKASPVFLSPLSERGLDLFTASMTTSGHASVGSELRSFVLVAIALVGLGFGLARREDRFDASLVAGMFFLPWGLSIAALIATVRWYNINYTSACLPAFVLLTALGAVRLGQSVSRWLRSSPTRAAPVGTALALLLCLGLALPNLPAARSQPWLKPDWRGLAELVREIALPGEPIIVPNFWPQITLGHYLGDETPFVLAWESAERGQGIVDEHETGWLLSAGFRKTNEVRNWMQGYTPILRRSVQEVELHFFPDFETLLATRSQEGRSAAFERAWSAQGERFDFGGGEMLLQGDGWSFPERDGELSFQWVLGPRATLALPIEADAATTLRFRARAFGWEGATPQRVRLGLNETTLGDVELPNDWTELALQVPAGAWSQEANLLRLEFARADRPKDVLDGAGDRRPLAAAFDWLEVEDAR